jgi:hypothetical protein
MMTTLRLRALGFGVLVFTAAGPLFGLLLFIAQAMVWSETSFSLPEFFGIRMTIIHALMVPASYLVGAIPAAIAGLAFGLMRHGRELSVLASGVLEALVGLLAAALVQLVIGLYPSLLNDPILSFFVVCAVAGCLCAMLCEHFDHNSSPLTSEAQ